MSRFDEFGRALGVCIGYVLLIFACVGCGSTETVSPEIAEQAAELAAGSSYEKAIDAHAKTIATALAAQKLTGEITLENTQAIMAKLNTLEASLIVPKAEPGKEVIKSAPNPPAKANTALAPLKVATPGDSSRIASDGTVLKWNIEGNWNPTILETSAHLAAEHGIDTNGMTHQEMADIHAALRDGKPVAMKSKPVQYVTRGMNCPDGRCPNPSSRFVWRSRR